jgi:hypothetical protein
VRALLEIHYLPSIAYFCQLLKYNEVIIDDAEAFGRQSYRNRCYIAAANGKMPLIIPVKRSRDGINISKIEIDNSTNWQHIHWQSIQSAYGKSAFFEYYAPYLKPFYEKEYENLFGFNLEIIKTLAKILKLKTNISLLSEIEDFNISEVEDIRDTIHPKTNSEEISKHFSIKPYMQVFMEKHGFIPNLSILDLLMCEGPNAVEVIYR